MTMTTMTTRARAAVVAAAVVAAAAGCSASDDATAEASGFAPNTDATVAEAPAMETFVPTVDGYVYEPHSATGVIVIRAVELASGNAPETDPPECLAIFRAQGLATADDSDAFADDLRYEFGVMHPEGWDPETAEPDDTTATYEIQARIFATADTAAQLARSVLETVDACGEYSETYAPQGAATGASFADVAAEVTAPASLEGDVVRLSRSVTSYLELDGEQLELTGQSTVYLYPYGSYVLKVEAFGDPDDAVAAEMLADLAEVVSADNA